MVSRTPNDESDGYARGPTVAPGIPADFQNRIDNLSAVQDSSDSDTEH